MLVMEPSTVEAIVVIVRVGRVAGSPERPAAGGVEHAAVAVR